MIQEIYGSSFSTWCRKIKSIIIKANLKFNSPNLLFELTLPILIFVVVFCGLWYRTKSTKKFASVFCGAFKLPSPTV